MTKRCVYIVLLFLSPIFVYVNFYHKFKNHEENFTSGCCPRSFFGSM